MCVFMNPDGTGWNGLTHVLRLAPTESLVRTSPMAVYERWLAPASTSLLQLQYLILLTLPPSGRAILQLLDPGRRRRGTSSRRVACPARVRSAPSLLLDHGQTTPEAQVPFDGVISSRTTTSTPSRMYGSWKDLPNRALARVQWLDHPRRRLICDLTPHFAPLELCGG